MTDANVKLIDVEEVKKHREQFYHGRELLHSLRSVRYCKAEVFRECVIGTLRIPQKKEDRIPQLSFGFYMTGQTLCLIEDSGELKHWLEKQKDRFEDEIHPDQILLKIMEFLVENDIFYLSHFEKEMEQMEEELLAGRERDFFTVLTRHRQKLSELNAYYAQLVSIGDALESHEELEMVTVTEAWGRFTNRVERLQNHVHLLQDNVLQLRELYQSLQDAKQNKIMCILTVVTTLFLPLTLLTGWYGMNFSYMPELQWKYSYFVVIAIAVIIVIIEIIYFKKKKFF
ncbi:MAG: magnesium transporter [Lachnospiraceae bacterium]|nr:magnesium transporter [Lachnospiraceae bacterium]